MNPVFTVGISLAGVGISIISSIMAAQRVRGAETQRIDTFGDEINRLRDTAEDHGKRIAWLEAPRTHQRGG